MHFRKKTTQLSQKRNISPSSPDPWPAKNATLAPPWFFLAVIHPASSRLLRPRIRRSSALLIAVWCAVSLLPPPAYAQRRALPSPAPLEPLPSPLTDSLALENAPAHRDFPAMTLDAHGTPWIAYLEHDGKNDSLNLARREGDRLVEVATLSKPGVLHQPALAATPSGTLWAFWGQVDSRDVVSLRARCFRAGKAEPEITLAESDASDTFADAATDATGRVWVVWQSMRRGQADVFARWLDPQTNRWSPEIPVSSKAGGNWEPRIAFDAKDGAWVVFDSSRGGEFNLFLARVSPDGKVEERQITRSPRYEARARVAASHDGKSLWICAESGRERWGRPLRGHHSADGLNGQKKLLLGRFDTESKTFTEIEIPGEGRPAPRPALAVNLPALACDGAGNLWLSWRFFHQTHWRVAVSKYDPRGGTWSQPQELPHSAFGQDRHCTLAALGDRMLVCWASDKRENKAPQTSGVYLGSISPEQPAFVPRGLRVLPDAAGEKPLLHEETPSRPREEHHTWTVGGKTYRLVWGDLHRHTDFSNCRTGHDGCVLEHFRYAYDIAALDFMGTSDHTDIAKRYDPYEWWQTQRMVDVFFAPGRFHSLYAYEREQPFPWGHRNIVFPQRGGPIVYINRRLYGTSPWHALYPAEGAEPSILPPELWKILGKYGKPVAVISHTGATGMGTDWDKYDSIDARFENTVEIYQGARVSYEGRGLPQPTVGLRAGEAYTADVASAGTVIPAPPGAIEDFGALRNNGLYQHALERGHKLGVFASSDHISQHASFGGVYVEEDSRMGIIRGLQSRITVAATDKIFLELSCDGHPMGAVFSSGQKPVLQFAIEGTAPLKRVTLVRNESDYQVFEPGGKKFSRQFTDENPVAGENRYYLRVEQTDGNMAWSSPVWVTPAK